MDVISTTLHQRRKMRQYYVSVEKNVMFVVELYHWRSLSALSPGSVSDFTSKLSFLCIHSRCWHRKHWGAKVWRRRPRRQLCACTPEALTASVFVFSVSACGAFLFNCSCRVATAADVPMSCACNPIICQSSFTKKIACNDFFPSEVSSCY